MHAHKIQIVVADDHEVRIKLPSDFPPGKAELIVIADAPAATRLAMPEGADAAREFQQWLDARLGEVPRAPVLPSEAFDRSAIYDD